MENIGLENTLSSSAGPISVTVPPTVTNMYSNEKNCNEGLFIYSPQPPDALNLVEGNRRGSA